MTSRSCLALALALAALPPLVQAQQIYRSVTPDGRVVFSDVPPPDAKPPAAGGGASDAAARNPALPFALREVTNRFPVTLYTGPDCAPCNSGRALLAGRGIPYSEATVTTDADAQALQRLSGERSLPLLTIGSQHVKGFSSTEWHQYLDAAGYPKTSALPGGWKPAQARPLAPQLVAAPAAQSPPPTGPAANATPPAQAPSRASSGNGSNPAGIQF